MTSFDPRLVVKVAVLLGLLALFFYSLRSLEDRTLYYPEKGLDATPRAYGWTFEDLRLKTEDGVEVHGWYIPGTKPFVLLLAHGNAGTISHRLNKAALLRRTGAGLLLFDYRGYGQSAGRPSEQGTYRDAEAAYRYLTETKGIPADHVFFYGESLGCAVALEMALRHPGAGVILESPFTSTVDMGKLVFPWLPVKWLVRHHYDNLLKIPKLTSPLLLMHSPQDEIVPFHMGQRLFQAAPDPKTFLELKGGHNEGYMDTGERYVSAVKAFVEREKRGD